MSDDKIFCGGCLRKKSPLTFEKTKLRCKLCRECIKGIIKQYNTDATFKYWIDNNRCFTCNLHKSLCRCNK